ncbi:tRNA (adenosine(37)-N6)-dimethylallyltransferase MiaA [Rothia kristinae]|uniref:tRNA (adenosine(37)-N6)-dimethylallyltransferase MiaA n=1 Tax=Rothia kristinae TaxID=37923 RepID=UPI0007370E6C|nr:tRNA (adenosine(37)-N6)-dimethylallyltransferase MiaA [Rothia kristinae]TDP56250.1 tRNA dimethylallyltransferase [Kocuria sp. AG109]SIM17958.1 tRNA isopentenyltransferase MiaA [Mycobacteroides abscessus subsp. abscessus]KTR38830.1 tRNA delta(2)-isopentenylpyrophosphate transferase [Rothia kristinae]KTR58400.1 tRNA delta(2)-isopentenylpyrophosphate transferase [Rothia kristinae]KTR70394.1 tRNA delta(2)-isopentenylpyrophosphate transferase [Rothia kristinae]
MTLPIIAVLGPTGTGKSDLGVALAREVDGEVVNADSMQLYRGMDIGTAKLTPAERDGVPHHLLDVLDVREEASVARYQREARERFAEIRGRGRTPILVGGSGLYARAALDVLEFPPTDAQVRQRWQELLETEGRGALAARLEAVDPVSARRGLDDRRLVRALEVHELTGRPFSSYMPRREHREPALQIGLNGPRDLLHDRLAVRVHRMVEAGLLQEVRDLAERGLREGRTASHALGYAQFLRVVDGETSEEEAVQETIIATRRFARRQVTWFRADPRVTWIGFTLSPRQQLDRALTLIEQGRTPETANDGGAEG